MTLRIATNGQLLPAVEAAGFIPVPLPALDDDDIHRGIKQRLADGERFAAFFEQTPVDLVIDFDAVCLTLLPDEGTEGARLATEAFGIPYAAIFIDPITSVMNQIPWEQRWALLEHPGWAKAIWDRAHAAELTRLGVPNVLHFPMAVVDHPFNPQPATPDPHSPPVVFIGHPASSFFSSKQSSPPGAFLPGMVAAAAAAADPAIRFHDVYFDLYHWGQPPGADWPFEHRAAAAERYFQTKFTYNAYLALQHRDRFAIFLKKRLGDRFELIGDHWDHCYGLTHTPRIWGVEPLYERIRRAPICLNLVKGNLEDGVILRHFETCANGGFLLTIRTPDLPRFLDEGRECDAFDSERELLQKIEYYLAQPEERRRIALAGRERTLREHLYSHRLKRLVAELRQGGLLASAGRSARSGAISRTHGQSTQAEFQGV